MMKRDTPIEWLELKPGAPLGARIWYAMKQNNLSGEELAQKAMTSRANISNWITGRNEPTATNLMYLAKALGVSMDWLAGGEEDWSGAQGNEGERLKAEAERGEWGIFG